MKFVRVTYIKVRRRYLQIANARKLKKSHAKMHVGLVSCNKWKNRVYDDLLLQGAFLDSGVKAEIISWQDSEIDFAKFDALLVTSMWGYQDYLGDFWQWIEKVRKLKLYNAADIICNNCDKAKQIDILKKNQLPVVRTKVIKKSKLKQIGDCECVGDRIDYPIVIKPGISSGGEDTFLVHNRKELADLTKQLLAINVERDILIQPFLPEIENGEISVVMFGKEIVNALVRFPGVLKKSEYIVRPVDVNDLDARLVELCSKVARVPDFCEQIYMRVDVVQTRNGYVIMEVELFEPQLFYYLLSGKQRVAMLNKMVQTIKSNACYNKGHEEIPL